MKTISLEQFKHHYYKTYPNSTLRLGQLFCLVFIDHNEDWQDLYYCCDYFKTHKLIYKYLLDNNICFDKIPLLREDLL